MGKYIGHGFIDLGGHCGYRGGLYGERPCFEPERDHPEVCGVDQDPDMPGMYVCDEVSRFPHHDCGLHHDPERISCADTERMMAIEQSLMRYAR